MRPNPPIRGWNSWQSYGVGLNEESALANARVQSANLLPIGDDYFCIDGGWMSDTDSDGRGMLRLDPHARYLPSRTYFPRGLSYVAEKVHELGLKFGLHIMRGIPRSAVRDNLPIEGAGLRARDIADTSSICSWSDMCYGVDVPNPAGRAYYDGVFNLLGSWGVDFIKADDLVPYPDEIEAILASISRAEKKHGRTIRLSLSPGNVVLWDHMPTYHPAAALRITPDL